MLKKSVLLLSAAMLPAAFAYGNAVPQPLTCMTVTPNQGEWNETLTITNHCQKAIDMRGTMVQFDANTALNGGFWGDFNPLAYPSNPILTATAQGDHYVVSGVLNFPEGNKWWKPNTVLSEGSTITMSFSVKPSDTLSNFNVYASGPTPPVQKGEIDFALPKAPSGITGHVPAITVKQDHGSYQTTIKDASWGQTNYALKSVPYGDYTISVANAQDGSGDSYVGHAQPNHLVIQNAQGMPVAISFTPAPATGAIVVDLPQQAVVKDAAKPVLHIKDVTAHKDMPDVTLAWNHKTTIADLPAGDTYALSTDDIVGQYDQYMPAFTPGADVVVVKNTSKSVTLHYQHTPIKTERVSVDVTGLPKAKDKVTFTFTDQLHHTYQSAAVGNGHTKALMHLPVGREYNATAQTITVDGKSYSPTLTPAHFAVSDKPVHLQAKYQANSYNFVAYWTGWSAYELTDLAKTKVNVVDLSFANVLQQGSDYVVDTSVSGYIADVPKVGSQMWPSYVAWTKYAYDHPNTKFMLSVGGATFSAIWTNVLTQESAMPIAKAIVAKLKTEYPVYSGNFANQKDQLGIVHLAGVDIDAEAGGQRLNSTIAANVSLLINDIKQLDPTTLVTFAGFSVGADPEGACTVSGSVHCGEDLPIFKAVGHHLDWVNVMAYDAGEDYAKFKYQEAMQNYANAVGKDRAYLGLDLQPQWDVPHPETPEELATKAKWAVDNGYGGIMFWAIMQNSPGPYVYLDTISSKI